MEQFLALIIVPVYNTEKYILECLSSISKQTYQKFICMIVDDGSTDRSAEYINNFLDKENNDKFIYLYKPNGGVSSARNFALDKVKELQLKPDYVFFIDSDDYVHQNFLLKFISEMSIKDYDYAVCGYTAFSINGLIATKPKNESKKIDLNLNQIVEHYFTVGEFANSDNCSTLALYNKAFKYDLVKDFRFDLNISSGEDMLFFANCAFKLKKGIILPENLYFYRLRKSSAMHNQSKQEEVLMSSVKAFKKSISINKDREFVNSIISRFYIILYDGFKKLIIAGSKDAYALYKDLIKLQSLYPNLIPNSHKKKIKRLSNGFTFSMTYLKIRNLFHKNKSLKKSSEGNYDNFFD